MFKQSYNSEEASDIRPQQTTWWPWAVSASLALLVQETARSPSTVNDPGLLAAFTAGVDCLAAVGQRVSPPHQPSSETSSRGMTDPPKLWQLQPSRYRGRRITCCKGAVCHSLHPETVNCRWSHLSHFVSNRMLVSIQKYFSVSTRVANSNFSSIIYWVIQQPQKLEGCCCYYCWWWWFP